MSNPGVGVLYALAMVAVVVGADLLSSETGRGSGSGSQPTSASSSCSARSTSGSSLVDERGRTAADSATWG